MCLNTGLQLVLLFGKVVEETGGEAPMLEAGLGVLESGLNSYFVCFLTADAMSSAGPLLLMLGKLCLNGMIPSEDKLEYALPPFLASPWT